MPSNSVQSSSQEEREATSGEARRTSAWAAKARHTRGSPSRSGRPSTLVISASTCGGGEEEEEEEVAEEAEEAAEAAEAAPKPEAEKAEADEKMAAEAEAAETVGWVAEEAEAEAARRRPSSP